MSVEEQLYHDRLIYGCSFERIIDGITTRIDPTTIRKEIDCDGVVIGYKLKTGEELMDVKARTQAINVGYYPKPKW